MAVQRIKEHDLLIAQPIHAQALPSDAQPLSLVFQQGEQSHLTGAQSRTVLLVCVCVCVCARACVCVCVRVRVCVRVHSRVRVRVCLLCSWHMLVASLKATSQQMLGLRHEKGTTLRRVKERA